jgi:hypothetical protein
MVVRYGEDFTHPKGCHTFPAVYTEMLFQVCRDYPGLPDPRTLKAHEIKFFYNGVREELKAHTRAK